LNEVKKQAGQGMRFEHSSFEKNEDRRKMSVQHKETKLKGGDGSVDP
jgi:hypothetical protein